MLGSLAAGALVASSLVRRQPHTLGIPDLKMPGVVLGLDLVRDINHGWPETLFLVITAHGTVETAVEAMRLGAHDYLAKPVDLEMLGHQVRKAFEHHHRESLHALLAIERVVTDQQNHRMERAQPESHASLRRNVNAALSAAAVDRRAPAPARGLR